MRKAFMGIAVSLILGVFLTPGQAGEVTIYTGNTSWVAKGLADEQAAICAAMLGGAGISSQVLASDADQAALATWMTSVTGNGEVDVLIIYGYFPSTIYPGGNAQPDGSIAELFIESTDGDAIINHGDWMFYVSSTNNGDAGLYNMMDIPGISMTDDNTAVYATEVGRSIAPSIIDFASDRPLHLDQLAGEWVVEAAIAQNAAGTRADPVIVRDGNRGRLIPMFQSANHSGPKGAVAAEVCAWIMGVEVNPTQLGLAHQSGDLTGQAIRVRVQLLEANGIARPGVGATVVTLETSSATGAFDTAWNGAFDGTVSAVTVPDGQPYVDLFYKDTVAGTPTLTAAAAGLGSTTLDVAVRARAPAGEVVIYTGNFGWTTKVEADAQAQICVEKLDLMGVTNTWYADAAAEADIATWMTSVTADGQADVLVLYGYFPPTIYPGGNAQPDGSIAELFIESTDGDTIINHADWMFYVSNPFNNPEGLMNMMDIPGYALWDDDDAPMAPTLEGLAIAPSVVGFRSDRPFRLDALAGDWFVEAALAQLGTRADPVVVRDGDRGRLIPIYQSNTEVNPKGAVAAETIAWIYGIDLGAPVKLGLAGKGISFTEQVQKLTVQAWSVINSPSPVTAPTEVALTSSSGTGVFDLAADGSFDGSVTTVTIPADAASVDVYYKDATAGTPVLTASTAGLTAGTLQVTIYARSHATPGEVAIYTGNTNWIAKTLADAQATICGERLADAGITATWFASDTEQSLLADWVSAMTGNGKLDVLVLYGYFPPTIYAAANAQPNGSIAELFIESTDGDTIINHGDWMFYVSSTDGSANNGPAGLENMMDTVGVSLAGYDNAPMVVTARGKAIAPNLADFLTDRPLHLDTLGGNWLVEEALAASADGLVADPVIVRDGDRGRLIPFYQAADQNDPKGAVSAEVIAWLLGTELVPSRIGIAGSAVTVTDTPVKLTVRLEDGSGTLTPSAAAVTVDLASSAGTGAFDTEKYGNYDGSLTSVTIPAGQMKAVVYYKDGAGGTVTLSGSVAAGGLVAGQLQVEVQASVGVLPGSVAIYTGNVGWITKEKADAEAQISVDALNAAGIVNTWYANEADQTALAEWMTAATADGNLDVLVLYGYFPSTIYPGGNAMPDGSIAELFIESTDGDVIMNHADWMFYVSSTFNAEAGLQNMMDIPGIGLWGDNTPVTVTAEGSVIAPSLADFVTDRPFPVDALIGDWFVEAALAENADGTRADPVILREGNRGRLITAFQAMEQDDPKGAVGAEIIVWLMAKATGEDKPVFRRGDSNADGEMNITDGIFVLNFLFLGGPEPPCVEAGNANDDDTINITDGIFVLNFLFLGGPEPPAPGPTACGADPVGSVTDLGCLSYTDC